MVIIVRGQADDIDPRALIQDGKAIVATMNYRLGVLGSFAHRDG